MKTLAKLIYSFFYWVDCKTGKIEEYDYETAPYCGHHYNGHKGKFTQSSYHEGDGGCSLTTKNPFLKIGHHIYEGWEWTMPCLKVTRTLYFKGEKVFNRPDEFFTIKGIRNCLKSTSKAKRAGFTATLKYSIV